MNDLRLLQQVDPNKKVISLQFKQINSLETMLPLLAKFENLQSLSLHGNRLKNLPGNMSCLKQLVQLDISNNLFIDIDQLAQSLKTLPALTHLIMNFKNYQQQNLIKNSLPKLQRVNKKPIISNQMKFNQESNNQKKLTHQISQLNQKDLQSIGQLYDEIRQIYRNSKYFVDKQLADDFNRHVDHIMNDLQNKLKNKQHQMQRHCNFIIGRYALIDICFVKLITYFYHFDKKIARVLENIHDYQAEMFKNMTDLIYSQILSSKISITQIKIEKQELFKTQIKRLKMYQDQAQKQIQYVQNKNKQLMEKLIKYGKSNLLSTSKSRFQTPPFSRSPNRQQRSKEKQNNQIVYVKNKPKTLSYHQLKEIINQIYNSKQKHNIFCTENHLPLQTMETHMYTYLNQKYGLKSLAIQLAMSIVNGIKKYGLDDAEIATFGKILRNQCDQQFLSQLHKAKQHFIDNLKKFKKNLGQRQNIHFQLTLNQSQQILLCMHFKRQQLSAIMEKIKDERQNNLISIQKVQMAILQYLAKRHDEKISKLNNHFKTVDDNQDGIINIQQLQKLMKFLLPNSDMDKILEILDPSKKGIYVFFHLCETFLKHPDLKEFFKTQQ